MSKGFDYSKWDHIDVSSSEEEELPNTNVGGMREIGGMGGMGSMGPAPSKTPVFAKLGPGDNGAGLNEIFFTDPHDFQYEFVPGWGGNEICGWGVVDGNENVSAVMVRMTRRMQVQFIYSNDLKKPEEQFCDVFKDRYLKDLAKWKETDDAKKLQNCDFVLSLDLW